MNCRGWSRGDSGEEHEHQSDAVLGSVMVFRLAAGAVAEVVVPLGLAKAGFLSGSTGVLGVVAAAEERSEDAKFPLKVMCLFYSITLGGRNGLRTLLLHTKQTTDCLPTQTRKER